METFSSNEKVKEQRKSRKEASNSDFLLKEYDRLVEYQKITIEGYERWFNVYITIATSSAILIIPLMQTISSKFSTTFTNLTLLALCIFGIASFIGLSYLNANSIQYERAIRLIQDAFIKDEDNIKNYLYFRKYEIGIPGTGFRSLIIRGLSGGSPKSLIVSVNSLLLSVLIIKVCIELNIVTPTLPFIFLFGLFVYFIFACFHLALGKLVYRVHRI